MASPLVDDAPKDIKNMLTVMEAGPWLELGFPRLEPHVGSTPLMFEGEESGELVGLVEIEAQSERSDLVDNYYAYHRTPAIVIVPSNDNDAAVSIPSIGGVTLFNNDIDVAYIWIGDKAVSHNTAAIASSTAFNRGLTIRRQIPVTHFNIWPVMQGTGGLTRDSEQLTWGECRQVLSAFASHAREVLEHKKIEITGTRIRDWQAIDDTNWKQCILDLTVKAESHIALRIWDELSEELKKFINTQPEVFRPFLEDKLSLDVKWV